MPDKKYVNNSPQKQAMNELTVLHINVRSLLPKIEEVRQYC